MGGNGMKRKSTYCLVVYENEPMGHISTYYGGEPELHDLADEMFAKGYDCKLFYVWGDGHRTEL